MMNTMLDKRTLTNIIFVLVLLGMSFFLFDGMLKRALYVIITAGLVLAYTKIIKKYQ